MDKSCYEQLRSSKAAREQLWLEISSEMESRSDWSLLSPEAQAIVRKLMREVIVDDWE